MSYFLQVVRHGQTTANVDQLISGLTDVELTKEGKSELENLAKDELVYPKTDLYFVSPLKRAKDTLKILYGNVDFEVMSELSEIDFGTYELRPYDEAPDFYKLFMINDASLTGNTYASYKSQLETALLKGISKCDSLNKKSMTFVGHQGTCRMLYHIFTQGKLEDYRKMQFENGKGFRVKFEIEHQSVKVEYIEIL